jgi:hypothetical protein
MKNSKTLLMLGSCGAASLMLVGMVFAGNGKGYELAKATGETHSVVIDTSVPVDSGSATLNGGVWTFAHWAIVDSKISLPAKANAGSPVSTKGYTSISAKYLSATLEIECIPAVGGKIATHLNLGDDALIAMPTEYGVISQVYIVNQEESTTITFTSMTITYAC